MKRQETNESSGFVCPYCFVGFSTLDAIREHLLTDHGRQAVPDAPGTVTLTVNGQVHKQQVQPEWTLYYLIHDIWG